MDERKKPQGKNKARDSFRLTKTGRDKLEKAVIKLKKWEQLQQRENCGLSKPARTFFIHGEPFYGQRWLVNILGYKVPYYSDAWKLPIRITPTRKGIKNVWDTLAGKLSTSPSPEAISNQLYEQWRTSTVILVIHNVNLIARNSLPIFIQQLWKPLVNRVNNTEELNKHHKLLLFLVDETNSKSNLERLPCLVQSLDKNQPQIHLEFLELKSFNQNDLKTWVGLKHESLSKLWSASDLSIEQVSIEQAMLDTLEGTHTPISVLKQICECFEFNWEQDIEQKLAL